MKIVLDTSVLLKLYIPEIDIDHAKEIMWAVNRGQIEVHVPTLVRYELLNSLIKGLNSATETASHFDISALSFRVDLLLNMMQS